MAVDPISGFFDAFSCGIDIDAAGPVALILGKDDPSGDGKVREVVIDAVDDLGGRSVEVDGGDCQAPIVIVESLEDFLVENGI